MFSDHIAAHQEVSQQDCRALEDQAITSPFFLTWHEKFQDLRNYLHCNGLTGEKCELPTRTGIPVGHYARLWTHYGKHEERLSYAHSFKTINHATYRCSGESAPNIEAGDGTTLLTFCVETSA